MTRAEYADYLLSDHWQRERRVAIHWANGRCQNPLCEKQGDAEQHRVEVHHLTYERLGREQWGDLIVLCTDCHRRQHGLKSELSFDTIKAMIIERLNNEPLVARYQAKAPVRSVEEQLAILRGDRLDPDAA